MIVDRFAGEHSTGSARSVAAFENAVWSVLAHRPQAAKSLDVALALDPTLTAAHALRGFCAVSLARRETIAAARRHLEQARAALSRDASDGERALVEALALAVEGRLLRAAERLETRLSYHPHDILAFKLSHALRFMSGDAQGMLKATKSILSRWSNAQEGYGFLLGCHAFALEENGFYAQAEKAGRTAVEIEPFDAWGAHAVGHVHEMRATPDAGIDWLEQTRPLWAGCNNFGGHMAWHLALCHVEKGRFDAALDLYDREIRAAHTEDFRDIANAVSLLWRLRQEKAEVGRRWDELGEIARRRAEDATLVFASLHGLLAALGARDFRTAARIRANLAERAKGDGDQSSVASVVGLPIAAQLAGDDACRNAGQVVKSLAALGGSRAQRDIFLRALAAECSDTNEALAILNARGKTGDRFDRAMRARLGRATERQVA